jgi:hypothetical protein
VGGGKPVKSLVHWNKMHHPHSACLHTAPPLFSKGFLGHFLKTRVGGGEPLELKSEGIHRTQDLTHRTLMGKPGMESRFWHFWSKLQFPHIEQKQAWFKKVYYVVNKIAKDFNHFTSQKMKKPLKLYLVFFEHGSLNMTWFFYEQPCSAPIRFLGLLELDTVLNLVGTLFWVLPVCCTLALEFYSLIFLISSVFCSL